MSMTQPARRKIVSSRSSVKRYLHVGGSDDEGSSNISINNQDDQQDAKPFPWLPMSALSSTLIAHTATLASFYTYIGVFVQNIMGLETVNSAGYYAGWLASAFTFGRLTTSYMWGLVADRIGRKPVIVIGMLSIVVCSIGFGLSTNFATALMWS